MKRFVTLAVMVALAGPVAAQDAPEGDGSVGEGFSLLEEGARMVLRGIIAEMGPAWDELMLMFDELNAFHPPEVLPNGDIIIRRKTPGEMADEDAIEL